MVVSDGSAGGKGKRWMPRRDTEDFDVATALFNVNVSRVVYHHILNFGGYLRFKHSLVKL